MLRAIAATLTISAALLGAPPAFADADGSDLTTLTGFGDFGRYALPFAGAFVAIAHEDAEGVVQLTLTVATTLGLTQALKVTVDRERPNGGRWSFPSGHTSTAFAGASFLHYRYGWEYGVPAYALASVVAYSRVEADKHYWSDVIGGAALGTAAAYVFTDMFDDDVSLMPFADVGKFNFGITAIGRF